MSRRPRLGQANPALSTLYNAPDIQESRRLRSAIAEIDTDLVETEGRLDDRLQLDVQGLKDSIAQNGQRVPVLLRPISDGRYRLIYGRRRLEASRQLGRPVRAIITELEDQDALKDQLLENIERRDLSFIERALVANALLEGNHLQEAERSAKTVAEILNLTEAGVSQLLGVFRALGSELVEAIGPAPSIGRPRWEELKKALLQSPKIQGHLLDQAVELRQAGKESDAIFTTILAMAKGPLPAISKAEVPRDPKVVLDKIGKLALRSSAGGKKLQIELQAIDTKFLGWMQMNAPELITELHERWKHSEGIIEQHNKEAQKR